MGFECGVTLRTNTPIKYFPWFAKFDLIDTDIVEDGKEYTYQLFYYTNDKYVASSLCTSCSLYHKEGNQSLNNIDVYKMIQEFKQLYENVDPDSFCVEDERKRYEESIGTLAWTFEWMTKRPQDIISCNYYESW